MPFPSFVILAESITPLLNASELMAAAKVGVALLTNATLQDISLKTNNVGPTATLWSTLPARFLVAMRKRLGLGRNIAVILRRMLTLSKRTKGWP